MWQTDSLNNRIDSVAGKSVAGSPNALGLSGTDSINHRFSVWRIAQQMGDCTPQQLDSAIQANLPVREKVRSERPDTLCIPGLPGHKTYESEDCIIDFNQGFFQHNPLLHPELPYRSQGMSAVPVPYALWRDDLVTTSLLLCLIVLTYVINKIRVQLKQQTKDFFFAPREHTGFFAIETSIETRSRLFLIFLLCLMGGLMMFAYAQYDLQLFLGQISPHWLLGIYVASFAAFFFVKWIISSFTNWVFFPKSQQRLWRDSSSYLISIEAIIFFPLQITAVYFRLPFENSVLIFLFILLIIKILLAFKTYRIFFQKSYCLFHLFAYLCALELMPLLALWKSLDIITENLIVKY